MDEIYWNYTIFVIACMPWLVYVLLVLIFTLSIGYGRLKLYRKSDPLLVMDSLPGVSVVKPLMGVDPCLEKNLETHFTIKYPKYELLLCVQDQDDPAIELVNSMRKRYPLVDCRLFIGGRAGILNPMVHNMAPGYDAAKYDIIWVSTSRIAASIDMLLDMVAKMQDPNVALVHQMPYITDRKGLASAIEKIYFGASTSRYFLAFNVMGVSCFTGMSYLVSKPELDKLGGLSWFGKFLAEDFFIAKYLHGKGFRHQVAAVPAQQNVAGASISAYRTRMVRWLRLRLNMIPLVAGFLEPLGESIPLGVYAAWSASYFFGVSPYMYFACHWFLWFTLDYINLKGIQNGPLPFGICTYTAAWVIREALYIFIYIEALMDARRIKWGKRTYKLSNFGETIEITSDKSILPI